MLTAVVYTLAICGVAEGEGAEGVESASRGKPVVAPHRSLKQGEA